MLIENKVCVLKVLSGGLEDLKKVTQGSARPTLVAPEIFAYQMAQ